MVQLYHLLLDGNPPLFFLADQLKRGRKRHFVGTLVLKIAEGVNTLLPICVGDGGSFVMCSW